MSQSRRSYRPRVEALEERTTPATTPNTHVLDIVPPPPSSAPSHQVLITQSACHAISAQATAASAGKVSCSL